MANKNFKTVMLVMILAFGMMVCGYVYGQSNNGTLTLTDIPAKYNGKFACFLGHAEFVTLVGLLEPKNSSLSTLVKITDGKVVLPMWYEGSKDDSFGAVNFDVYSSICTVKIFNEEKAGYGVNSWEIPAIEFDGITFSKGSAVVSVKEGKPNDLFK